MYVLVPIDTPREKETAEHNRQDHKYNGRDDKNRLPAMTYIVIIRARRYCKGNKSENRKKHILHKNHLRSEKGLDPMKCAGIATFLITVASLFVHIMISNRQLLICYPHTNSTQVGTQAIFGVS